MSNLEVISLLGYVIACFGCAISLALCVHSCEQDKQIKELEKAKEENERKNKEIKDVVTCLSFLVLGRLGKESKK